LRCCSRILR